MADSKSNYSRRLYARYRCRLPVRVVALHQKQKLDAVIVNLGVGGALVSTEGKIDADSIMIEFGKELGGFYLEASLVRDGGRDAKNDKTRYYAVTFRVHPGSGAEAKLKALIDRLRSTQTDGPNLRRDYWSI